jgi:hypothetical protein
VRSQALKGIGNTAGALLDSTEPNKPVRVQR